MKNQSVKVSCFKLGVAAALTALVTLGKGLAVLAEQPPKGRSHAQFGKGVVSGYQPTKSAGPFLKLGAGTVFCHDAVVKYAGGKLKMVANATNYVYLGPTASCAPTTSTKAFGSGNIRFVTVLTGPSSITSINSVGRTFFTAPAASQGGGITSLKGLTPNSRRFATPTSVTDFNISSSGNTHTINLPNTSATTRRSVTTRGQALASANALSTAVGQPLGGGVLNTPTLGMYLRGDGTNFVTSSVAAGGAGACAANQFVTATNDNSAPTCSQPAFSNLSGSATAAQLPSATTSGQGILQLAQDLGGTAAAPKVGGLQGISLSATTPASGQVYQYNSSSNQWIPTTLATGGTVSSVGLSAPAEFTVSGSPVSSSGTLTFTKANQSANLVYAGPSSGAAAEPTFRNLVAADLPSASTTAQGAVQLAGDFAGAATAPKVAGLQGNPISNASPTTNQVLQWNGSNWTPTTLIGGSGWGITSLDTLTASSQTLATGTSGTDFNISSSGSSHTFNIPDASASARGLVTTSAQTFAGAKTFSTPVGSSSGGTGANNTATLGGYLRGTGTNFATSSVAAGGAGACAANQFVTAANDNSAPTCSQPAFTNISGVAGASQLPDATTSALGTVQLAGDLRGTATSPTVIGLQTKPISSTAPSTSNQFLGWSGTQWAPTQPAFSNLTGVATIVQGGTGKTTAGAAFDALAPTTTQGDLIVRGATSNQRLAAGPNGQCLTSNGITAVWGSCSATGTTGSGTTNMVAKFSASSTVGNSQIQDDGTNVSLKRLENVRYADQFCTTPGTLDETCINNAINDLPAAGGTVILPNGTVTAAATITFPTNKPARLTGQGYSSTVKKNFAGGSLFTVAGTLGAGIALNADAPTGSLSVQVNSTTGLVADGWLEISDTFNTTPQGTQYNRELVRVDSITGTSAPFTVNFATSLDNSYKVSLSAQIAPVAPAFTRFDNFIVDMTGQGGYGFLVDYAVGLRIDNVRCSKFGTTSGTNIVISTTHSRDGIITNNEIGNANDAIIGTGRSGNPIGLDVATEYFIVSHNNFYKTGQLAIENGCHHIIIENNTFDGVGDDAINLHGANSHYVIIRGNLISGSVSSTSGAQSLGIAARNTDGDVLIEGNIITNYGVSGIGVIGNSAVGDINNVIIRGNLLRNPLFNPAASGQAAINVFFVRGAVVEGNSIYDVPTNQAGIRVQSSDLVNISNNIIRQTRSTATGDVGLYLISVTNGSVTGNVATGLHAQGIRAESSTNVTFVANNALGNTTDYLFSSNTNSTWWTSGTGAPTGSCMTGSTYVRTDGGTGTTLYVCEASAWHAK